MSVAAELTLLNILSKISIVGSEGAK